MRMRSFPRTLFLHTGVYLAGSDKRHVALKGCYRLSKLFFPGVIFTPDCTVMLGLDLRLNLCGVGSDTARGWEEKETVLAFYMVPCGVNPTNTTTCVH